MALKPLLAKSSATSVNVTVNAAFLREIKEVHEELWVGLEELRMLCGRPISLRSQTTELVRRLSDLLDKLALHFTLEEAFGYFDDPVYVSAAFSRRVDDLRNQHRVLYAKLCRIVDESDAMLRRRKLAALTTIVPIQFERFARELLAHEEAEMELTQDGWCDDLGVGD